MSSMSTSIPTAGIIIIGDEVLKGQVKDENSPYLLHELYRLGVKVKKVSVVGDELDEIADEVRYYSKSFDFVFTTGGIGPTHDDITYEGVALAFGDKLEQHVEMSQMIQTWLGDKGYSQDVIMKMGKLPSKASLLFDPEPTSTRSFFPIIVLENVYIFPGIPSLLFRMFKRMKPILNKNYTHDKDKEDVIERNFYSGELYLASDELAVTPYLNTVVEQYKGQVTFGSYPVYGNIYYSTRLTMESHTKEKIEDVKKSFEEILPKNLIVPNYDPAPLTNANRKVYDIAKDPAKALQRPMLNAIKVIEEALEKYPVQNICVAFTGGKDCTVLLHLFHAVIQEKYPDNKEKIRAMFIRYDDPFPEMEKFIHETSDRYNLTLWEFDGPLKHGLETTMEKHPEIQACLLGTRSTDPRSALLEHFQMTDPGWPQIMRVSPLLEWNYSQVWRFLRSLSIPYCSLYDRGYTSIGSRSNTKPNEALLDPMYIEGESIKPKYRPAYTLDDSSGERNGRN